MVRSLGIDIATSADLVQEFEAVWTDDQLAMHKEACGKLQKIILEAFGEIKRRVIANEPTTEVDVQKFMMKRFSEEGMRAEPMIVAVNANAASPHYFPDGEHNSPIKRGDLVLIDSVSKLTKPKAPAGRSDVDGICRRNRSRTLCEGLEYRLRGAASGVQFRKDFIPESQVYPWRRCRRRRSCGNPKGGLRGSVSPPHRSFDREEGHGNGANIDNLETRDSRRLIPRTAFSIEPGIYLDGKFGVRSEIDVYVSENDAIITAPHQTEILAIMK
jgi:Xaa-Pro aminopeptidase